MMEATEQLTLARAKHLGLALPEFTAAAYPALFDSWRDRVMQAHIANQTGQLTAEMLDNCDRQIGVPGSRVRKRDFAAYRTLGFTTDPIKTIAKAVGAICGDDAGAAS